MKALRTLDAHGRIQLPAPRHERRRCRPRGLGRPVPAPADVPARADLVQGLALVAVTDDDQRRVWNELLQREHPRGAARHVGAQLRYLLVSDHGVLGALGFAASALTLAARDAFIGWDADRRSRQLHRVIALSRFLIRPCVDCRNLASKALGLCLRRLPDDFQRRYGYRPLLVETFVAKDRHAGTSLAAANWLRVGETAGRGRFAASGTRVPVKVVYLYPLARDWRAQLGVAEPPEPPALGPGEGLARDVETAEGKRAAGRCTLEQAAGAECADSVRGADEIVPGGGAEGSRGGEGPLPPDRPAGGLADHAAEHPGAAPAAHAAPHAGPGGAAVHPGRHGSELRRARRLRGAGPDRQEQQRAGHAGPAHALDAGGQRGGYSAGRAADPVRGAGRQGGARQAAGGAQDDALDPGAARVRGAGHGKAERARARSSSSTGCARWR